jgi:hypothetical protein
LSSTSFCNPNPILSLSLKNTYRLVFFVPAPNFESSCTHANESSPCQPHTTLVQYGMTQLGCE